VNPADYWLAFINSLRYMHEETYLILLIALCLGVIGFIAYETKDILGQRNPRDTRASV
jgi:hypothetical protein